MFTNHRRVISSRIVLAALALPTLAGCVAIGNTKSTTVAAPAVAPITEQQVNAAQ